MVPFPFKKSSEVEKRPDFVSCCDHAETKSISIPIDRKNDFVEDKIEKANNIVNRRGEINRIKKSLSRNGMRKESSDLKSKDSMSNYDALQD